MRAVFVNFSHPATPHVSAVRVPAFARHMAMKGHRVVLLTKTLGEDDPGGDPSRLRALLQEHDWCEPLHLTARGLHIRRLEKLRAGTLPKWQSKFLTAWSFVRHGGVHWDWSTGASPLLAAIAGTFRPEVVWATFLPSDNLVMAQRLARAAGCPWHLDLKDAWSYRLPAGTRRWMARKFKDAKGFTANSRFHGELGERWFKRPVTTVYDGVSKEFLNPDPVEGNGLFRIVLVGGTYGSDRLGGFLKGLRGWLETLRPSEREKVVFSYAGTDSETVREAIQRDETLENLCRVELLGYLPLSELARLCKSASVNAYIWFPSTFHHKLLDLLACGRPIIAFPGEGEEAVAISTKFEGRLHICRRPKHLENELSAQWNRSLKQVEIEERKASLHPPDWNTQAALLEAALIGAIRRCEDSCGAIPNKTDDLGAESL